MKKKIKRIFSVLSAFIIALVALPNTDFMATAEDEQIIEESAVAYMDAVAIEPQIATQAEKNFGVCGENLTWSYDSTSKTLTIEGTGTMTNWSDASYVPWYSNRKEIYKVVLPDGITDIGCMAFCDCTGLTDIIIPDSVTGIWAYAFYNCSSLTSIIIPNGVTSIGAYAFKGCTTLTGITIPNSVTSIGSSTFSGCTGLTSITIPDSVTSIGNGAFYETPWLKAKQEEKTLIIVNEILIDGTTCTGKITVPDSVTSIGGNAFKGCTDLISIAIPDSVTSIGEGAFWGCTGLTSIAIPDSVTSIGSDTFHHCTGLTSIAIPNSVTSIGSYAFDWCLSLSSITIPDSVTSIGEGAFWGCTSLTDITIPDSVTSIGSHAFYDCTHLTAITIKNPYCKIYDNQSTISDTATIYSYPNSIAKNYAERYNRKFVTLGGEPTVQYSYEITPILAPFNHYFFVKTDNPDPESFRFFDKNSIYGNDPDIHNDDAIIDVSTTQFADVKYDDPETLRVNGGYIFTSFYTDGGKISLQLNNQTNEREEKWEDSGLTFILPTLYDEADYLINTYATKSDFFANMDAVQFGFSSICLYSGSGIRGEVYKSSDFWSVSTSPHIDQHFYIYSPYSRKDNKSLFATAIYPFRYDSLGFPSMMRTIAKRLDSSSSCVWSSSNHAEINVTYGGETHTYGGAGQGKGQGLSEDKISRFFTFDCNDAVITLENIRQLLDNYANVEMDDDIPREDALTWEDICDTVGDGAWVRVVGGYAYLYYAKKNYKDYYDEWGVGNSIYWWGSLGYGCDTWVDGRYIDAYEEYVPGETFEDHPESDIILSEVALPIISYDLILQL